MKNTKIKIKIEFEDTNSDVILDAKNWRMELLKLFFHRKKKMSSV